MLNELRHHKFSEDSMVPYSWQSSLYLDFGNVFDDFNNKNSQQEMSDSLIPLMLLNTLFELTLVVMLSITIFVDVPLAKQFQFVLNNITGIYAISWFMLF